MRRTLIVRPLWAGLLLGGSALAGLTGGAALAGGAGAAPSAAPVAPAAAAVAQAGSHASLADMVEAVGPSVVQIQVKPQARMQQLASPFDDQDLGDRLGELFGFDVPDAPQRRAPSAGALGSGFIIDESGLILTNNHVVDGADEVTVQLSDGRELPGKVLGRDSKTDVAVVKIQGRGRFQPIRWGDSDRIRVGDSVFAVGSPFGLGNTVTAGIVSARSREIGAGPYDDFLQVDAAINSGNSGGPLFDASGRVVGVNTAIFSPSGGNVGIGFAIPARMAQSIAREIVDHGTVSRGRIGVVLQALTPELALEFRIADGKGALISDVDQSGPAARAGLAPGDIVRSFAGKPIADSKALARAVADAEVGSRVPVAVLRNGRALQLTVPIGDDVQQS